jgi:hypothetical protein
MATCAWKVKFLLTYSVNTPYQYNWSQDAYMVCPDCVRAHERRFCNATVKISFRVCSKHISAVEDEEFEQAILDDLRRTIHPLHSTVPPAALPRKVFREHYIAIAYNWDEEDLSKDQKIGALGQPTITYDHTDGCIYSSTPSTITVPTSAIHEMDKLALMRLENINLLLDSNLQIHERPHLRAETIRLEKEIKTSNVAKGVFSKRCNGDYRNALGDYITLKHPQLLDLPENITPSEFGYALKDLTGTPTAPLEYDENGWPKRVTFGYTFKWLQWVEQEFTGEDGELDKVGMARECYDRARLCARAGVDKHSRTEEDLVHLCFYEK